MTLTEPWLANKTFASPHAHKAKLALMERSRCETERPRSGFVASPDGSAPRDLRTAVVSFAAERLPLRLPLEGSLAPDACRRPAE